MNVETFMHNIQNLSSDDIIDAFDRLMALFELCNGVNSEYENIQIAKTYCQDGTAASFDLIFNDYDDAKKLHLCCNGLSMKIFDILYRISCELDENDSIVHIVLK